MERVYCIRAMPARAVSTGKVTSTPGESSGATPVTPAPIRQIAAQKTATQRVRRITGSPLFYAGVIFTLLGLAGLWMSLKRKKDRAPFWESSFTFVGLWLAAAAAQFPNLIRASNDPQLSLTIYNSSTGLYTLQVMSVIALVGMPIVVGYTVFVYRIFKGKAKADHY